MKVFLTLCLLSAATAFDSVLLPQLLKSPKATLKLYSDFKSTEHLQYGASEDRMRFRVFRRNAEFVAAANSVKDTAQYGLNFLSSLTAGEKKQYLGLNATGHLPHAEEALPAGLKTPVLQAPSEKLWVREGAVTPVKNQGSCGSCWTFGAVGGLETRYKQMSGKLRNFAEQEYLDCVSNSQGCDGGWPSECYRYSRDNGRLAASSSYPYEADVESCKASYKPDALVAYRMSGYRSVSRGEAANIQALSTGSLTVAFEVTDYFNQYEGGILRDTTCSGSINHAVTAVGYTLNYVLVKNSWGGGWGDRGFVKFARGHGNCRLFDYSYYPTLASTGKADNTASDAATNYSPSDDDDTPPPSPGCVDEAFNCVQATHCSYSKLAEKFCKKTCGKCGGCPSGTIRCSDGICRHEHMC